MSNSGTSINFDAQAIHDAEEAEYHREEKERENEVCHSVFPRAMISQLLCVD